MDVQPIGMPSGCSSRNLFFSLFSIQLPTTVKQGSKIVKGGCFSPSYSWSFHKLWTFVLRCYLIWNWWTHTVNVFMATNWLSQSHSFVSWHLRLYISTMLAFKCSSWSSISQSEQIQAHWLGNWSPDILKFSRLRKHCLCLLASKDLVWLLFREQGSHLLLNMTGVLHWTNNLQLQNLTLLAQKMQFFCIFNSPVKQLTY